MKKKVWIFIAPLALMGVLLLMNNCNPTDTTVPTIDVPSLTTTAISDITLNTATSGGVITNGGGSAITAKGVCWSTTPSFTIDNGLGKTTDGTGNGSFISYITGLETSKTYYVRAYAINSTGTGYGDLKSFQTANQQIFIGNSYQGGIVAYILQPGDPGYVTGQTHGIIAAPSDQSTGVEWGCIDVAIIGADGGVIGTGAQNTIDIVTGCTTAGIAAKLCYDLVLGGYSDWFLPSTEELSKLYLNRAVIGGFAEHNYWSSSEYDSRNAYYQYFTYGTYAGSTGKDGKLYVRAVRYF